MGRATKLQKLGLTYQAQGTMPPTMPTNQNRWEDYKTRLIGQDHVVDKIAPYVQIYEAGLSPEGRPAGNFFFMGPTGVGKTLTIEELAFLLHGDRSKYLRIDCGELQMDHEIAKLVGCFSPDTLVQMANGSQKAIENISIGDEVISKDGNINKVIWVHEYDSPGELINLKTSGNYEALKCTKDHKIWAIKINKTGRIRNPKDQYQKEILSWVKASDLDVGDIVVFPRLKINDCKIDKLDLNVYKSLRVKTKQDLLISNKNAFNRYVSLNEDFYRFAGYFVADGCSTAKNITFTLGYPQKKDVLEDIQNLIHRIFGEKISISVVDHNKRGTCKRLVVNNKTIASFCRNLFYREKEKGLPEWFVKSSENNLWNFLDAAISCDGSSVVSRRIDYSSTSFTLISQINLILKKLGVITQIQKHSPKQVNWKTRYRIYIAGDQIESVSKNLKFVSQKLDLTNTGNSGIQRQGFADEDFIYSRITEKTTEVYSPNNKVYDIAVENEPSYIANGKVVSNSPPGFLGHRETKCLLSNQTLANVTSNHSNLSLVLFDEAEKGSFPLQRLLLGILDKARLTTGDNQEVSFERSLIFFTSNIGYKEIGSAKGSFAIAGNTETLNDKQKRSKDILRKRFAPEFINRLDEVIVFRELDKDNIWDILEKELEDLQAHINKRKGSVNCFSIEYTEDALLWIVDKGFSPDYGARELKRVIRNSVLVPVSKLAIDKQLKWNDTIKVGIKKGELAFTVI